MELWWKTMKFLFQTSFWINGRILNTKMPFSYIKLYNCENICYVAYPPEALFWPLKEDKYIPCRCMKSFVYLRNLATSDMPISGFPGCWWPRWLSWMRVQLLKGGCGFNPGRSATFFHGDFIMKYFLRSFSPFHWFKKVICQFLAKECSQYRLTL